MQEQVTTDRQDGVPLSFGVLISIWWARRLWVASITLLSVVGFFVVAQVTTPVYRSSLVMVPALSDSAGLGGLTSALGQLGGLASLAGINLGPQGSATEESLAVLRSRDFTERFIRSQGLMPLLYPDKWDSLNNKWRVDVIEQPTLAQAYKLFDKRIRHVNSDTKTGLVTLHIDWKDPDLAAAWANALVDQLNAEMRNRATANSDAALGYLQKELVATTLVDTRLAIMRLLEAQVNQRMLANVTQEYAFRIIDRALPSDPKDPIKPRKVLLIVLGAVFGFFLGCVVAVMPAVSIQRSDA